MTDDELIACKSLSLSASVAHILRQQDAACAEGWSCPSVSPLLVCLLCPLVDILHNGLCGFDWTLEMRPAHSKACSISLMSYYVTRAFFVCFCHPAELAWTELGSLSSPDITVSSLYWLSHVSTSFAHLGFGQFIPHPLKLHNIGWKVPELPSPGLSADALLVLGVGFGWAAQGHSERSVLSCLHALGHCHAWKVNRSSFLPDYSVWLDADL